jgi:hypothetical protein
VEKAAGASMGGPIPTYVGTSAFCILPSAFRLPPSTFRILFGPGCPGLPYARTGPYRLLATGYGFAPRDIFSSAKQVKTRFFRAPNGRKRGFFERQTGVNEVFSGAKRAQTRFFRAPNGRKRGVFERQTGANEVFSSAKRTQMG